MRFGFFIKFFILVFAILGFVFVFVDGRNVALSEFVRDWTGTIGEIVRGTSTSDESSSAHIKITHPQVNKTLRPPSSTTNTYNRPHQSEPAGKRDSETGPSSKPISVAGTDKALEPTQSGSSSSDVGTSTAPTSAVDQLGVIENPTVEKVEEKPVLPSAEEIIKKLLSTDISADDKKNTAAAFENIKRGRYSQAKRIRSAIKDPNCQNLVDWYGLINGWNQASIGSLIEFMSANPDWPGQKDLNRKVEAGLLSSNASARQIKEFYKNRQPESGTGKILLANVYFAEGQKADAEKLIRSAWRDHDLSKSEEALVLKRYGSSLRTEDHHHRAHRLLYAQRKSKISAALRAAKHLDAAEKKKINARIAELRRTRSSGNLLGALPEDARNSPEILFSRVRWHRRKKSYTTAWKLLAEAPNDESAISPDDWWKEARWHVREALNKRNPKIAYKIAKNHANPSVNYYNQAEFLAGWLALRFLKKPDVAKEHFLALAKSADGPRSKSRAHYWLGRTALDLGDPIEAKIHFSNGAKYFNTYYGQLSHQALDPKISAIEIEPAPTPSEIEVKRFLGRDSVLAINAAHKAGLTGTVRKFLAHLRYQLKDGGEFVLLAELAKQLGETQQSVRIGKRAMFLGFPLTEYAYPTHAIPEFEPLRKLPEMAIIYGITRQESEFNTEIVSHAGARGLMQVMPITARHVARDHKIRYQKSRLISDPVYNAKIGSAYIADRMDEFSGSYIMTFAGFNAGPGRVRQWVRLFGDPRNKSVDPIDWVERIPFNETRNYVKKVMANVQVYRARLGESNKALQIAHDLNRGRKGGAVIHSLMHAEN